MLLAVSMTVLSAHIFLIHTVQQTQIMSLEIFRQRLHLGRWGGLDSTEVEVVLEGASRRQRRYLCLNGLE